MSPFLNCTPLVLAGGLGSRLAGVWPDRPKALAPVGGRPFVTYLLDTLIGAGFEDAVVSVGFRAEMMESSLGSLYGSMRLRYVREDTPMGTGGAVRMARDAISTRSCLVLNGDSFCGADLGEFLDWHESREEPVGMVLAQVEDAGRYGSVEIDGTGRIRDFREKDPKGGPGWINAGIYSIPTEMIERVPAGQPLSLERDVFPKWLPLGMAGYCCSGPFIDIGTPASYGRAEAFFQAAGKHSQPTPR